MKGHKTMLFLKELEKQQWLTPEKLKELQVSKLRELLECVDKTVSYYHEILCKANLRPEDVNNLEDIQGLPFLLKDNIRDEKG